MILKTRLTLLNLGPATGSALAAGSLVASSLPSACIKVHLSTPPALPPHAKLYLRRNSAPAKHFREVSHIVGKIIPASCRCVVSIISWLRHLIQDAQRGR